ncbi:YceD family protein [Limosilactobacillus sp.]|uniref:YceD family protein n=1 Tax=Limosilactobacillus sp. TaxID=2773925 RepID=UPI003EFF3D70
MKWSLAELHRYQDEPLHIQSTFDLNASLTKLFPDIILAVAPVKVDGYVSYDDGDATISAHVVTTLTVPSSRSLTPVQLPLDFDFTETYIDDRSHFSRYEDDEVVFLLKRGETIDFDTALAENIVEQVPLRVLSADEKAGKPMPNGKGWNVISEDEYAASKQEDKKVDPRFAKLQKLFPDQDDKK